MVGNVPLALMLTSLGAMGTALGGLLVVAIPDMSFQTLGILQVGHLDDQQYLYVFNTVSKDRVLVSVVCIEMAGSGKQY